MSEIEFKAPAPSSTASNRRKRAVRVACNSCRTRKTACDGIRPLCKPCRIRLTACVYDAEDGESRSDAVRRENRKLRQSLANVQQVIEHLQSLPDAEALEFLRRYRSSNSDSPLHPAVTVDDAITSPYSTLPSGQTLRALSPPTQTNVEFELMVQHPASFPALLPFKDPKHIADNLLKIDNLSDTTSSSRPPEPERTTLPPPAKYCDDRLQQLNIAYWTTVPISDHYAASVISLYLENDHPLVGMFDADLFLRDLVNLQHRYCSSLLVNAILYYESQAYTAFDPAASSLSIAFYTVAKNFWQLESESDSFLNVAALQVLAHGSSFNGLDAEGGVFIQLCCQMAERLGLQDDSLKVTSRRRAHIIVDDALRFRSHIAWGYFSARTAYAFYYRQMPATPPLSLPIPGSPGFRLPAYMGQTFTSLCKLWVICENAMKIYNESSEPVEARVPLAIVEAKYQALLKWADDLPVSCVFGERSSHHTATMHIWYHTVLMFFIRPYTGKGLVLNTFTSADSSPDAIFNASLRRLKRLAILYRQLYPQARYHIQWHPALLYVANAVLAEPTDPEWQFYFLVCLYGYQDLYAAFPLAALCFKSLLTVALESRKIPAAIARHLVKQLAKRGAHHVELIYSDSGIRVDTQTGKNRSRPVTVDELAQKFNEMAKMTELNELDGTDNEAIVEVLEFIDPLPAITDGVYDDS